MDILSIIQAVSAIVTPLVILLFGLLINRRLEQSKLSLSKEKEWQTKWADAFFISAGGFNLVVEEFIHLLIEAANSSSNDPRDNQEEKSKLIWSVHEKIKRMNWTLTTQVQFAPKSRDAVLHHSSEIMELLSKLLKEKQGDLGQIQKALFEFNAASKAAHRELLAL